MKFFTIRSLSVLSVLTLTGITPCFAAEKLPNLSAENSASQRLESQEALKIAGFLDDINRVIDTTDRVLDTVDRQQNRNTRHQQAAPQQPQNTGQQQPQNVIQPDFSRSSQEYQRRMGPGQNRIEQMFEERRAEQARRQAEEARRQEAFEQLTPEQQEEYLARQREQQAAQNRLFIDMMRVGAEMDGVINGAPASGDAAAAERERQRQMSDRMSRPLRRGESR